MSSSKRDLIFLKCGGCGRRFKVETRYAGRKVGCPSKNCTWTGRLPSADQIAAHQARKDNESTGQDERRRVSAKVDLGARGAVSASTAEPSKRSKWREVEKASDQKSRPKKLSKTVLGGASVAAMILVAGILIAANGDSPETNNAPNGQTPGTQTAAKTEEPEVDVFKEHVTKFLSKYCFDCHSGDQAEGGLQLEKYTTEDSILADRKRWEKLFDLVEIEAMPPSDMEDQPTDEERKIVVQWLENKLFNIDCTISRDPGRVTIRRLNRTEYNNTIRDLVGVKFRPADDFPSDDVGYGFDNIGDVLTVSPLLLEKYLAAAEEITEKAIIAQYEEQAGKRVYAGKKLRAEPAKYHLDREGYWNFHSAGSAVTSNNFPQSGEYLFRVRAYGDQAGPEPVRIELRIDSRSVKTFDIVGDRKPDDYDFKMKVDAGNRRVEAAFVNDFYNPKDPNPKNRDRNAFIKSIEIRGPLDVAREKLPESHRHILTAYPRDGGSAEDAARQVLRPFMRRAFRRNVDDKELAKYAALVNLALDNGDSYEVGIQLALQGVLVSPEFLFRVENSNAPNDPDTKHDVGDYELASRLSYFLWSSMPDDELLDLAEKKQLRNDNTLRKQVVRMLVDKKSAALADNFGNQWLNLQTLEELTPDEKLFPEFNDKLRNDMSMETLMFFREVMEKDLSILAFLDGRFTFLNERLAKLYGIDGVQGEGFRRVNFSNQPRAGVLTQASILTLTSNPTRTSPVKRGKWIMENILGSAPPPPPPNVPELEETAKAAPGSSLREQLEVHRKDPGCASCHRQMDELGFGFENFNAIGIWRDREDDKDIDASGMLPGDLKFTGPLELIKILKSRRDEFAEALSEKMLTYALGRGLEYYDKCAVDRIVAALKKDNYRFSTLVTEIVSSEPFRMRRGDGGNQ